MNATDEPKIQDRVCEESREGNTWYIIRTGLRLWNIVEVFRVENEIIRDCCQEPRPEFGYFFR